MSKIGTGLMIMPGSPNRIIIKKKTDEKAHAQSMTRGINILLGTLDQDQDQDQDQVRE